MLLGSYPRLLVLALSLPEVSQALGLGNMRVESMLNEPLSAQIDIIGATPDELQTIRASVASAELFQRFNAERPAFLSSATFSVGTGATGNPVLNIQSTDAFTEPLVEFLIELQSGKEHLVRDYSLLLDPTRATSAIAARVAAVSSETSSLLVEVPPLEAPNIVLATAPVTANPDELYRIVAHDTLRGIARHAAAPPPDADLSAVLSAMNRLTGQVQYLQQALGEARQQLDSANRHIGDMERRATQQPVVAGQATTVRAKQSSGSVPLGAIPGGCAILVGALVYAWRRSQSGRPRARKLVSAEEPTVEAPVLDVTALSAAGPLADTTDAHSVAGSVPDVPGASDSGATAEMTQVVDVDVNTVEVLGPTDGAEPDTVVMETLEPKAGDATSTVLDYNLSDLDGHAQHVEMPDTLRDQPVSVERRKNVVDTLLAALQRDPTRSDLHMKLLETLYTAAATNLRIFKDAVRELVRHPERLNADEWQQVMAMGRQIAADDALFTDQGPDEDIADCA